MSVGLWNFFADPAISPSVQLDGEYSLLGCIGCDARTEGERVILSDIPAFGFAAFEVCPKKAR